MKLTSEKVHELTKQCVFENEQDIKDPIITEGIMGRFGFDPIKINEHSAEIKELLEELPDSFRKSGGGGCSFLSACYDRHENHWAEHPTMELLFQLGTAAKLVKCVFPREIWSKLPGGMPYYQLDF